MSSEHEADKRAVIGPREDLALIAGYYSPQLEVEYRMNTNEAPEEPPVEFVTALTGIVESIAFNRYPDLSAAALRQALAKLHGVDSAMVFCANGSNEVLQSILLAYGGPKRFAAVFEPTYTMHAHIARVTGTGVLVGERDDEFLVSDGEVTRIMETGRNISAENPAITFLCSPNNPTGRIEPTATIERVLSEAPGLVVVDEAYGHFASATAIDLVAEHPQLVVVRTFSKAWSLAALRLGYAIASPEVVNALESVALPYHLDAIKQAAGTLALEFHDEMLARVARLVEQRGRVIAGMLDLAVEVFPSDANFVLFRVLRKDASEVWNTLIERSVLVRNVSDWPYLAGCLRVTIGTPEENNAFVAALREALA